MSDRVRVTFEIPKKLLEFVDNECEKKSTEIMKLTRSSYLRKLIIEARDGNKEVKEKDTKDTREKNNLKWEFPKGNNDNGDNKEEYGELLKMSGYKR